MNMKSENALPTGLKARLVRYDELRPCTNAFIDARTPGSDRKENFTIIGPGVAENPHQYVHIQEPHGFNIGAARQPPHCTNSLHSHDSEEVFLIHTGTWRFFWGEHGDAGEIILSPGDTISIPIHVFRGFENVGKGTGFMFAVLGKDNPGRVHWAPHVIEKAKGHGLLLLDNGILVDTTEGESVPAGASVVGPSSREEISYIRVPSVEEMLQNIVRSTALQANPSSIIAGKGSGFADCPIIGIEQPSDVPPIRTSHGFNLRCFRFDAGGSVLAYQRQRSEVVLIHRGRLTVSLPDEVELELWPGDTFTIPPNTMHGFRAAIESECFVVFQSQH